jgi:peptidoglycan hydrolase-like protein with peptidoglycan-binding domain
MKKFLRFGFLPAILLFTATGCAHNATQERLNSLEAQVGVMTDEIARLDQALQEKQAGSAQVPGTTAGPVSENTAIYKTPSGFELPSADIQKALKGAGYYKGALDGKIGATTKDALKSFQQDNGLSPDGVCGRRTWDKLKVYLSSTN